MKIKFYATVRALEYLEQSVKTRMSDLFETGVLHKTFGYTYMLHLESMTLWYPHVIFKYHNEILGLYDKIQYLGWYDPETGTGQNGYDLSDMMVVLNGRQKEI